MGMLSLRVELIRCARGGLLAALSVAFATSGCGDDDPCPAARQKLEACKDRIQKATAGGGFVSLPVTFPDGCTGQERCIGECAIPASCNDLAVGISGGETDPNSPPMLGGFSECVLQCTRTR